MGLDALIPVRFAAGFIRSMKNSNQNTSQIRHPLFVSPRGLDQAARMSGEYFAEKMNRHGQVLFVGGLMEVKGEDGSIRQKRTHTQQLGLWQSARLTPYTLVVLRLACGLTGYVEDGQIKEWIRLVNIIYLITLKVK